MRVRFRVVSHLLITAAVIAACCTALAALDPLGSYVEYLERSNRRLSRFVLDNGMIGLVKEDHSAPVAAVQIWVGTGSIHEESYLGAGMSHYLEHMLFKGTETRGPTDISREISEAGGDINAYTSLDRTVYHVVLPSESWEVALDVLADAVMNASFPEEEWRREKEVIRREMAMGRDSPERIIGKLLFRTAYRVHPYRFPVIGYESIFDTITRDDLFAFYERHYVPDNMLVVVAGDVDAGVVEKRIRSTFADFMRRPRAPVVIPREPRQIAPRSARKTGPFEVARLRMAYHTVPLTYPDAAALDVLSYLVGHGRSSRLVSRIKEEQKLAFEIDAWSHTPMDPGLFGISATYAPERETDLLAAIEKEVTAWTTPSFTEDELEKAKRQLVVAELSSLETMRGQASSYASGEFYAGSPTFAVEYLRRIGEVSTADLAEVAGRYLRRENRTLAILEPETSKPPADEETEGAQAPRTEVTRQVLSNGIPLIARKDHRLPFVHISVALGGGLLAETEANNGITRLMADLLTRGTASRSAEEIARTIESMGARLSPFSGWNSFGLQGRALAADAETLVTLASESLLSPTFPQDEIEKQRDVQIAEIRQERERPFFLAFEQLKHALFPNHPYRLNPTGREESVHALDRRAFRAHHRKLVTSENMVVSIFGDVKAAQARRLAEAAFSAVPRAEAIPLGRGGAKPELPAERVRREPKEQAILLVGYPGVEVTDPRADALSLIRESMSGLSSELGIEVRDKRGLVYYVGALQRTGLATGLFAFYAGTRPESVAEVQRLIDEQVSRLVSEGPREDELTRAKAQTVAAHKMSLQDNGALAQTCALNELYGLGYDYVFSTEERIRGIDREELRAAAASVFQPEARAISLLLPEGSDTERAL